MSYGQLTPDMLEAIESVVQGKVVVDLGAGSCRKARWLVRAGAKHVHAVDKDPTPLPAGAVGVTYHEQYLHTFAERPPEYDVAFVSWPVNHRISGLVDLCQRAKKVIYIGCNYEGSACGFREFYLHMIGRELLAEVQSRQNTMLILGDELPKLREPSFEEKCGLSGDRLIHWSERF